MTDKAAERAGKIQKVADREWATARRHAALLLRGRSVPSLDAHNLSLALGETAVLRTVVTAGGPTDWGEDHAAAVVATSERLVISHRLRGWQSFWFTDLTWFEPNVVPASWDGWALTTGWHPAGVLRLSGVGLPALAVHVCAVASPDEWMNLPGLQALLDGLDRGHRPPGEGVNPHYLS